MKNWKETTLGEAAEIIGGGTPKTDITKYWNGDIPWLSVVDFNNDNRWVYNTEKHITEEGLKNSSTRLLNTGDLIISARGTVGAFAQLKIPMAFNQSCYGLRAKDNSDNNFLYYLLKQNIQQFKKNVHGAVFDTITRETFDQIEILLPPLPEQRAIAAVFSSLDDKIELLREQNKTLEATAQAIFKEWFVNFNFPGATGKMIDSELGKIPEGWRIGKVREFGKIICGKTPSKENPTYFGGKIPFIKIPDMHGQVFISSTEDALTEEGTNTQNNKFIPTNSICVSCIATVGLVSITSQKSQTNQQINSIIPTSDTYLEYLFLALKEMRDDLLAIGTGGSATLNINTTTFSNIEMIFPEKDILDNFHHITVAIFQKINFNNYQIQTLSAIRDSLLPRLIKGEVQVKF